MKEEQKNEYCERIASYLICEGLFYSKYNIDEANALLDKTCLPTALKRHLKENEEIIKNMLLKHEQKRN